MLRNVSKNKKIMTLEKVYNSHSESETRKLGQALGKIITPGILVLLYGDLGTGKTVFVKGVGDAMKVSGVRSPSFTLINEYSSPSGVYLIHSDLYRLESDNVNALGLDEYIGANDSVVFVEWPERWKDIHGSDILKINFTALNESEREIKISASGLEAERIVNEL